MDIWKDSIQKDIEQVKMQQELMKKEISDLQTKDALQDQQIESIKDSLKDIKGDTTWLRRAITNAIIAATIGGAVAIFYAAIKNF